MTLDHILNFDFVDADDLPLAAHGTGYAYASRQRWLGNGLSGAEDAAVTSWSSEQGLNLTGSGGTIDTIDDTRTLHLGGTNYYTNSNNAPAAMGAFGLVAKFDADVTTDMGLLQFGATGAFNGVYRAPGGTIYVNRSGGTKFSAGVVPVDTWFTLAVAIDATQGLRVALNGVVTEDTTGTAGGNIYRYFLGALGSTYDKMRGNVAELVGWGTRLSAAELPQFHAAMQSHYDFL